jgi:hypothetical protein
MKKIIVSDLVGTLVTDICMIHGFDVKIATANDPKTYDDLITFLNDFLNGENYFVIISSVGHAVGFDDPMRLINMFDKLISRLPSSKRKNLSCYISDFDKEPKDNIKNITKTVQNKDYIITEHGASLCYKINHSGFSKEEIISSLLKEINYNESQDILIGAGDSKSDLPMLFCLEKNNAKIFYIEKFIGDSLDLCTEEELLIKIKVRESTRVAQNIRESNPNVGWEDIELSEEQKHDIDILIAEYRKKLADGKINKQHLIEIIKYYSLAYEYHTALVCKQLKCSCECIEKYETCLSEVSKLQLVKKQPDIYQNFSDISI